MTGPQRCSAPIPARDFSARDVPEHAADLRRFEA
jgi:hypothetical protein